MVAVASNGSARTSGVRIVASERPTTDLAGHAFGLFCSSVDSGQLFRPLATAKKPLGSVSSP